MSRKGGKGKHYIPIIGERKGKIKMEHTELMEQASAHPGKQDEGRLSVLGAEIRVLQEQGEFHTKAAVSCAVEIGRRLTEAKTMVPHGEWGEWLRRETPYSQSTAQNLMRVYRECGDEQSSLFGPSKAQALGNLSYTKVLRILTIPEGPERDEFLEAHDVESMSTRELDAAIKARDEALKAAEQAKAEQSAAEQARQKMAEDMAAANERLAGLNAEVEAQSAKAREAQDATARLERELAELRSRPVEVAVETDTAAIKAARKEAEAAMQKKLDKAKAAQAKAEADRKAAEDDRAAAQQELERVRADAQTDRARAEQAEKKAALASNEDLVLFQMLLDQGQEIANKLGGVLMKLRNKDAEMAGKLSQAVLVLSDRYKGVAEQ